MPRKTGSSNNAAVETPEADCVVYYTRKRLQPYTFKNQWSKYTQQTVGVEVRVSRAKDIIHNLPSPDNKPVAKLFLEQPEAAWGSFTTAGRTVLSWYQGPHQGTVTCKPGIVEAAYTGAERRRRSEAALAAHRAGGSSASRPSPNAPSSTAVGLEDPDHAPTKIPVSQRVPLRENVRVESESFANYGSRDTWLSMHLRPHSVLLHFTETQGRRMSLFGVYPHHEITEMIETHDEDREEYTCHWYDGPEAFTATIPDAQYVLSLLEMAD